MKKFIIGFLAILFLTSCLFLKDYFVSTPSIRNDSGYSISSMEYLEIGGVSQFVLFRSHDVSNPVLLFLHGGPGSSETAMFREHNEELEKHFTVVYWDQRGAAKSFSENVNPETIHLEQYLEDTKELINILRERFNQQKIYLLGHSWGTALGLLTAQRHPELIEAFISVGQIVHTEKGQELSYQFTLNRAKERNNQDAVAELEKIKAPKNGSYEKPEDMGIQRKWLLKLGGERYGRTGYSDLAWTILLSREYTAMDILKYLKGMELSFRMMETISKMNFFQDVKEVEVPVYFIAGKDDYNTPVPLIKEYAQSLIGPHVSYKEFEKSSHSPMYEQPEEFNNYLIEIKTEIEKSVERIP